MTTQVVFEDYPVGTMVVKTWESRAGCSFFPEFGIITKITNTGKYRITKIGKKRIDSPKNWHNVSGSYNVIIPDETVKTTSSGTKNSKGRYETLLTILNGNSLYGKRSGWNVYDPNKEYADYHDNGD